MGYQLVSEWDRIFENINELDDYKYSTIRSGLCDKSAEEDLLEVWAGDLYNLVEEYCIAIKKFEDLHECERKTQILQTVLKEHKLNEQHLENAISRGIHYKLQYERTDNPYQDVTVETEDLATLVYTYWRLLEALEETHKRCYGKL